MTLHERLRKLASALPSDRSAITITRADLLALLEEEEATLKGSERVSVYAHARYVLAVCPTRGFPCLNAVH